MEWVLVKTVLSLGAIIGLMLGLVFLLRKLLTGGGHDSPAAIHIRVLGTRTLQPKRSVCVIEVLGKVLVVGISEQGIQTLAEFASEEIPPELSTSLAPGLTGRNNTLQGFSFLSHLSQSMRRFMRREREGQDGSKGFSGMLSPSGVTGENFPAEGAGRKSGQRSRKPKATYA